jgi:hypothetical protein
MDAARRKTADSREQWTQPLIIVATGLRPSNNRERGARSKSKNVGKAKETKPSPSLEFVNLGSSPRLDEESKERVRSHAMIQFNRRKSEQDSGCTPPGPNVDISGSGSNPAPAGSRGRFRLAGTRARPSKKYPDQRSCQSRSSTTQQSYIQDTPNLQCLQLDTQYVNLQTKYREGECSAEARSSILGGLERIPKTPLANDWVGSGALDPFNSLPVIISRREKVLIDHCKSPDFKYCN